MKITSSAFSRFAIIRHRRSIMGIKNMRINNNILFIVILAILYFILDFHTILFLEPRGIHFIRQTDSLSFAVNYLRNGFDFFHPQVFNLLSTDGKAGLEFPILYFLTAVAYAIFGEHEFILRLITLIICSTGFLYLFKLVRLLLNDVVYAFILTFLFISSTVLFYYTNNFLPDASALGLCLIGWYFFFLYILRDGRKGNWILAIIFFTTASLLKVTCFMNPVAAMLGIGVLRFWNRSSFKSFLREVIKPSLAFLLSVSIVIAWYVYVIYYNRIHHDHYFLTGARPLWALSAHEIAEIWDYISRYWFTKYYYESTIHFFSVFIIAGLLFIRIKRNIVAAPAIFLSLGSIMYILLFYAQFKDHDYYFITLIPAIVLMSITSFLSLRGRFPRLLNNYIARGLLLGLCLLSLNYAREKLEDRYKASPDDYSEIGMELTGMQIYIDELGIAEDARFIIVTDQTPNGGLYFIRRPGWPIKDTTDAKPENIEAYIAQGAKYILYTKHYNDLRYIGNIVGEMNGNRIFCLE